jgi:hypothetical protein
LQSGPLEHKSGLSVVACGYANVRRAFEVHDFISGSLFAEYKEINFVA